MRVAHPFDAAPYVPRPVVPVALAYDDAELLLGRGLSEQDLALIRELRPEALVPWIVTGGSALLSVALYSAVSNPTLALGLVLGMWVHELGHRAVLVRFGIAATPIVFVPFVGAVQKVLRQPASPAHGAWMALAGPACGLLFALACQLAHGVSGRADLRLLAVAHAALALFDLLPFGPLDGSRVRRALALRFDHRIALVYGLLFAMPFLLF